MPGELAPALWGIPVVSGSSERAALFPAPATDQRVFNKATGNQERWTGAIWAIDFGPPTLQAIYNVKSAAYGAIGDGIVDDTTAIQNAINDAAPIHGKVFLPPGTYKITSTLVWPENATQWSMEGAAPGSLNLGATTIKWFGAANGTMMSCNGARLFRVDALLFDGSGTAGIGILWRNSVSGAPHSVGSFFKSRDLVIYNCRGTPGVSLYIGEGDASPGISNMEMYDFQSWSSIKGVYIDNGGAQNFHFYGGALIGGTYGLHAHYGGFIAFYGTDLTNNTEHIFCEGASAGGKQLDLYSVYAEDGTLLHWGNHDGGSVNIIGLQKSQSAGTPAIIIYDGGKVRINSIGNNFPYGIDLSPSVGNNELLVFSVGDQFITGGWTKSTRTFVIGRESAGAVQLDIGATFGIDSTGGQTRLAAKSVPTLTGATPSVAAGLVFEMNQAGATNVTDFLGSKDSQLIMIRFQDALSTLIHNAGKMRLRGAANVTPPADGTITLMRSGIWYEVARNF